MKCEKCIHYCVCMVNSYCHEHCGYYEERRGEVMDEYKALDVENNVKVAVKKLREAYFAKDAHSYANQFCEAKQIIISAICFEGYTLQKEGDEK